MRAVTINCEFSLFGKSMHIKLLTCTSLLILQTSSSASFLLYEIASHPEIQERLVEEITSVVGEKEHPSWDDLQKMTLLRNCVKETMRMYSPTGATGRTLERDAVLLGYHVPAGVSCLILVVGLMYLRFSWGGCLLVWAQS